MKDRENSTAHEWLGVQESRKNRDQHQYLLVYLHTCTAVVYANWPNRSSTTLVMTTRVLAMLHVWVLSWIPTRTVFLCLHEQKKGMCENWIKVWPGAHKRVSNFAFIIVCYLTLSHLYYSKSHTLVAVGFNLWVGLAHVILQPRGGLLWDMNLYVCMCDLPCRP